jgi:hypothetical protein
MPKENKILRMFRLLNDEYEVKVGKSSVPEKGERTLTVTLTVHGSRYMFNSKDDDFRMFIVRMAREDLGEAFSSSNLRDLNLQLETIATLIETVKKNEQSCGCGCPVDEPVDDE